MADEILSEDIGLLILDLSHNNTQVIKWIEMPKEIQSIFNRVVNEGIDKSKAAISQKDKELYIFSYQDAEEDYMAAYIVYNSKLIFSYEN